MAFYCIIKTVFSCLILLQDMPETRQANGKWLYKRNPCRNAWQSTYVIAPKNPVRKHSNINQKNYANFFNVWAKSISNSTCDIMNLYQVKWCQIVAENLDVYSDILSSIYLQWILTTYMTVQQSVPSNSQQLAFAILNSLITTLNSFERRKTNLGL